MPWVGHHTVSQSMEKSIVSRQVHYLETWHWGREDRQRVIAAEKGIKHQRTEKENEHKQTLQTTAENQMCCKLTLEILPSSLIKHLKCPTIAFKLVGNRGNSQLGWLPLVAMVMFHTLNGANRARDHTFTIPMIMAEYVSPSFSSILANIFSAGFSSLQTPQEDSRKLITSILKNCLEFCFIFTRN